MYESIEPYLCAVCIRRIKEWREWENEKRKFWWPYTFFLSTLTKTKIHHFSYNYIFYQQRLSNFLYTKFEKLLSGKGWIWHVSVNFNQASIKALRLPPYHSAIPQSKEQRFNPSSILITINMTHFFFFNSKAWYNNYCEGKIDELKFELNLLRFLCPLSKLLIIVVKLVWRNMTKSATKKIA